MKEISEKFKTILNKKTITKTEFADQIIEIIEIDDPFPLSPYAFELAVKWMYRKYKLGVVRNCPVSNLHTHF